MYPLHIFITVYPFIFKYTSYILYLASFHWFLAAGIEVQADSLVLSGERWNCPAAVAFDKTENLNVLI